MFLVIPAGIWLAWAITAKWAPEAAGHGVPQILASLTLDRGRIPLRVPLLKTIATALTIGVGGSAGREGSIAQIGAGIGSFIGRVTKLDETETRALVAAGAGAGIAATRHKRQGVLPQEDRRRQELQGSDPGVETTHLRRRLPATHRRHQQPVEEGVREDNQERLASSTRPAQILYSWLFGSVTPEP